MAIFEPVELEGTTVSRASLHNISVMEELQLGIGDEVVVYKANMIIPQLAENKTKSGNIAVSYTHLRQQATTGMTQKKNLLS